MPLRDETDPLATEITRALQVAQTFQAPLVPVTPAPEPYTATNLIPPGQDPALYDLNNPPGVQPRERLAYPLASDAAFLTPAQPDFKVPVDAFGQVPEGDEPGYVPQGPQPVDPYSAPFNAGGPDTRAPTDPYAVPPSQGGAVDPYAPPSMPATLDQAVGQEQAAMSEAGRAAEDAATAKIRAERDRVMRQADVYDRLAQEIAGINQTFQQARDAAHRAADAETQQWIQEVTTLAQREPSPHRWWENTNDFGKALWLLSLAFGTKAAAAAPGARNVAIDMIQDEIAKDIQAQKDRAMREMDALKLKGQAMKERQARLLSDLRDDHTMALGRIEALERAWLARAGAPTTADELAARAEAQAAFAQLKLGVAGQYREMRFQEKENRLQRAHAQAMQRAQLAQQERQFQQELDYKYWSKTVDTEVQMAQKAGKLPEARAVPIQQTGFFLRDRKTGAVKPIQVRSDEQLNKLNTLAAAGSELYNKLNRLADLIERDDSVVKTAAGVVVGELNPEIRALMADIAYLTAQKNDPGGRFSEMDVSKGGIQNYGFDPDGKLLDKAKYAGSKDQIVQMLRKDAGNLPTLIARKAGFDASIPGQEGDVEAVWDPRTVTAPTVQSRNAIEEKRRAGIDVVPLQPVKTAKEYDQALKAEQSDESQRGSRLLPHDPAAVQAAKDAFFGRGPDIIRLKAKEALDKINRAMPPDPADPWAVMSPEEAKINAARRRELQATAKYIQLQADAAAEKATKTLQQLETSLAKFREWRKAHGMSDLTLDDARSIAKSKKLVDAEAEVREVFDRVMRRKFNRLGLLEDK